MLLIDSTMKYLAARLKEKLKLPAASREEPPEVRMLILSNALTYPAAGKRRHRAVRNAYAVLVQIMRERGFFSGGSCGKTLAWIHCNSSINMDCSLHGDCDRTHRKYAF